MSAIFELPILSETLTIDEIAAISGAALKSGQIDWLSRNGWVFHKTRAGEPVVGRLYARLKLAGINPGALAAPGGWTPDLSQVK